MNRTALPTNFLVTALGITLLTLSGCSSPTSEMADAINKSLSEKPKTDSINVAVELPQLESNSINQTNGVLGLVLPEAKDSPVGKALADFASAKLIDAHPVDVYPEKNPNTFMKEGTVYIPVPDKAEIDSSKAKEILNQIQSVSPGTVWSNLGTSYYDLGSQGYVAQATTFDRSKMGKPDPDFFIAVRKNQANIPMAKQLAKLAEKGYLKVEDKPVYYPWNAPIVGEWTGDPKTVRFATKVDTLLYFMTDKGRGLVERRPSYPGAGMESSAPAVKLADAKVLGIVTLDTPGKNLFGQQITTVNFEETKTLTGINAAADLKLPTPPDSNGKPIISQVKIINGKVQDYKPSNLISTNPVHVIAYSVPSQKDAVVSPSYGSGAMSITLGQWKLKSVDNFSKDKNPLFGGQIAQCTFQFEYNPQIKPLIHQLAALGVSEKELPKSGTTRPYECIVSAMEKGYTSMGCSPASKLGGL